jgi:hypothetical protein
MATTDELSALRAEAGALRECARTLAASATALEAQATAMEARMEALVQDACKRSRDIDLDDDDLELIGVVPSRGRRRQIKRKRTDEPDVAGDTTVEEDVEDDDYAAPCTSPPSTPPPAGSVRACCIRFNADAQRHEAWLCATDDDYEGDSYSGGKYLFEEHYASHADTPLPYGYHRERPNRHLFHPPGTDCPCKTFVDPCA